MADVATMNNSLHDAFASLHNVDAGGVGSLARRFSQIDVNDQRELPTVQELLTIVKLLQGAVRGIGPTENSNSRSNSRSNSPRLDDDESPFTIYRSPNRGPRYYIDQRTTLKHHASSPRSTSPRGISDPRRRGTSVVSAHSPPRDSGFHRVTDPYAASGLVTPPPKHRDSHYAARGQSSVPRPATRVAALTRENISLLPSPQDLLARRRNTAGSIVSGTSQQSKMSARTDGGAVFSRLYQPDYYKTRDQKLRAIRDRQEHLNFNFSPATNHAKRLSISSVDSFGSSIGSMQSAKTDITSVSSRLYDPDYVKKRNARLARMREEREMRDCTFVPTINSSSSTAQHAGHGAMGRRTSSAHQVYRS